MTANAAGMTAPGCTSAVLLRCSLQRVVIQTVLYIWVITRLAGCCCRRARWPVVLLFFVIINKVGGRRLDGWANRVFTTKRACM